MISAPFDEFMGDKLLSFLADCNVKGRGGSRTAATSKMERFVIIVNGFQPLTIITKRSILDVAAVLDPPLKEMELLGHVMGYNYHHTLIF